MARIWALTSGRTGDDRQVLRLAEAVGVPFEEKKIVFNERARAWRLMLGPSLASVDAEASSPLAAPWPELVISTGWRQVPVVRFIKRASGDQTRLVQMNRPPGPQHFDLVLSPPQYRMPTRANVVRLDWPLQLPPDPARLAAAAKDWKERLEGYPHPWTVLLIGGTSHPFAFDPVAATRLFEGACARAREREGSLLISTSRRTPEASLETLREAAGGLDPGQRDRVFLYEWSPDASDNPYVAFLAGGDEFVVTPDSISMLVEVARLGRPLAIAPYSRAQAQSPAKILRGWAKRLLHGSPDATPGALSERVSEIASALGLKFERDLARVSEDMIAAGWAGDFPNFAGTSERPLPDDDFDRLVTRVRGLLTAHS